MELTAVFVQGEYGYTAYIDQMRGVITQGSSIAEAEENLIDALELYLEPDDSIEATVELTNKVTRKPFLSLSRSQ